MDRQTLRLETCLQRVIRSNAEGLAGLRDRHGGGGPRRRLSPEQEAELAEMVRRGPDLAEHGVGRWRRVDLAAAIERRFSVRLAERTAGMLLRRLGFRRLVARPPRHPGSDPARRAAAASFSATSPPS